MPSTSRAGGELVDAATRSAWGWTSIGKKPAISGWPVRQARRWSGAAASRLLSGRLSRATGSASCSCFISLFLQVFRLEQLVAVQREQQEEGRADQQGRRDENHHDGD